MFDILLIVHLVISFLLIFVILMQKTGADGLSGLSGAGIGGSGLVSAKTTVTFLHRLTIFLAIAFMTNAVILANLSTFDPNKSIEVDKLEQENVRKVPME